MQPTDSLAPEAQRRQALARVYSLLIGLVEEASSQPADPQQLGKPAENFHQVAPRVGNESSEFRAQNQGNGDSD